MENVMLLSVSALPKESSLQVFLKQKMSLFS